MTRISGVLVACFLALPLSANTGVPWEQMTTVGQARLRVLFWSIYEATLFSPEPAFEWPDTMPFALALEYDRDFSAADLVSETARQWQAMAVEAPANWLDRLAMILPDVQKGDTVTLFVDAAGTSTFYLNGTKAGTIADPEFSRQFSAIWLSSQTTQPALRRQLIGENE